MHLMPLTLDYCSAWAELLAASFCRSADETGQVLMWLHAHFPVTAWGAWEGEQLVAQYACLRRTVLIGGEPFEVGMSLNMAVHPDFRGRGLIKQVAQPVYAALREEGAAFGIGFSNAEGVKVDRRSKGYGYRVIGRLVSSIAYLMPHHDTEPLSLSDTLPTDEWDVGGSDEVIRFATTARDIHHRYAQHPFRRYRYGLWYEGSDLVGVVVYRPMHGKHGTALLAAYGHDLPELLKRWAAAMSREGVRMIHTLTTPNAQLRCALTQVGFRLTIPYVRSPYYLTVKPLNGAFPLNFAAWDCMGGEIL
jgi:GNAT superfamily N-acetyltransferase